MRQRHATVDLGGLRLAVVSVPLRRQLPELTSAELEVARLVARGLSNAAIARERGTSVRTVANQLRAILRKLALGSRRGIAAALLAGER